MGDEMTAATADQKQAEITQLMNEARRIQREQSILIRARRNPARYGQLERHLNEVIFPQVNALRAELAAWGWA
jgi:hypothetical protein